MGMLAAVTAGFSLGIFLRSVNGVGLPVALFVLLLAALAGGAFFIARRPAYLLFTLFLLSAALGVGRAWLAESPLPSVFAADLRHRVSYEGIVMADPDIRADNQRITVEVSRGGETTRVIAVVPKQIAPISRGDRVSLYGTLEAPAPFASEGGRTFRYDNYLEARGVRFLVEFGSLRVMRPAPWYSVPAFLSHAKRAFLEGLARSMPASYAALAGGVVIGGKTALGTDLENAFIRSGLVQVVVLSGYNVMVIAAWTMLLAGWGLGALRRARPAMRLPRALPFALGGAALLLFVGVAGFSATALRAMIMALIALYARATGKSYAAGRALAATVLLMLLSDPLLLAFDPGFGLSVVATAGLIWLAPLIEQRLLERRAAWLRRVRHVERSETLRAGAVPQAAPFWINAIATTLAAQIAVLPLLLYETGNLSLVALAANLLVMPIVPFAMAASFAAGILGASAGALWPASAFLTGLPAFLFSALIIEVAKVSAAPRWAVLILPAFPFGLVLLAYAALAAVAFAKRASGTLQFTFARKASTYFDLSAGR